MGVIPAKKMIFHSMEWSVYWPTVRRSGADSIAHGGTVRLEQQTRNWSNCTDHHESAHQND